VKEYYATLRIQQGRLRQAMHDMGLKTAAELSRISGVTQQEIGSLLNFKESPKGKRGEWKKATIAICKSLGHEPNDLFPDHLNHEIATNKISSFVESSQLSGCALRQIGPVEYCSEKEMQQVLDEVIETLPKREKAIVKARFFEGKSLREVGKDHNITAARVSDIERKALINLRHPVRIKKLEEIRCW
jgi:RNA polymerase sigma factor (sigma-70 family)